MQTATCGASGKDSGQEEGGGRGEGPGAAAGCGVGVYTPHWPSKVTVSGFI